MFIALTAPVFGVEDDVMVGVQEAAVLADEHLMLDEVAVVQTVELVQQHGIQLPDSRRRGLCSAS